MRRRPESAVSGPVYPKGERVWAGYYNRKGELLFIVTSKEARDYYFLYALDGDTFKKLGRAKSPLDLVVKYRVIDAIHGIE